jgi:hypothetical protein
VSSKTRVTTFRRIAGAGDIAPLLLQLMMAVNDMGIADDGLRYWSGPQPPERQDRAPRARSYFVRLQMAHAFEGLRVIGKIARTPDFMKLVAKCDAQTPAAFKRLMTFIGTEEYKTMRRMRDAITSHYLTEPIAEAINRQVDKFPDVALSLSIGSNTMDCISSRETRLWTASLFGMRLEFRVIPLCRQRSMTWLLACKPSRKI